MELRDKEGDDAFHPSIEYFLGNLISLIVFKGIIPLKKSLFS